MRVLALNSSSNSLKFDVLEVQPDKRLGAESIDFGRTLLGGAYDNIGKDGGVFSLHDGANGIVMGSRSGDLDPVIVPYLMRKEKMNPQEIDEFLNKQCGLRGLSSISADAGELVPKINEPAVDLAIDIFCYRVPAWVIPTRENLKVAHDTAECALN